LDTNTEISNKEILFLKEKSENYLRNWLSVIKDFNRSYDEMMLLKLYKNKNEIKLLSLFNFKKS
jgi:hypothetical protein